jgi:hypothetical protein
MPNLGIEAAAPVQAALQPMNNGIGQAEQRTQAKVK